MIHIQVEVCVLINNLVDLNTHWKRSLLALSEASIQPRTNLREIELLFEDAQAYLLAPSSSSGNTTAAETMSMRWPKSSWSSRSPYFSTGYGYLSQIYRRNRPRRVGGVRWNKQAFFFSGACVFTKICQILSNFHNFLEAQTRCLTN